MAKSGDGELIGYQHTIQSKTLKSLASWKPSPALFKNEAGALLPPLN